MRHPGLAEFMTPRLVGTHLLAIVTSQLYLPGIWEYKDFWHSRIVYTALRDAMEVERLMSVCVPWQSARECPRPCTVFPPRTSRLCLSTRPVVHSRSSAQCEIDFRRFARMS